MVANVDHLFLVADLNRSILNDRLSVEHDHIRILFGFQNVMDFFQLL